MKNCCLVAFAWAKVTSNRSKRNMFSQKGIQRHPVKEWTEREVYRWLKQKGLSKPDLAEFRDTAPLIGIHTSSSSVDFVIAADTCQDFPFLLNHSDWLSRKMTGKSFIAQSMIINTWLDDSFSRTVDLAASWCVVLIKWAFQSRIFVLASRLHELSHLVDHLL